jgi:hypothetical protein
MTAHPGTLYQAANAEILRCIDAYLLLTKATKGLSDVTPEAIVDKRTLNILLAGLGLGISHGITSAIEAHTEWQRRQAVPFDTETAITAGVYQNIRAIGITFLDEVERSTEGFTLFSAEFIVANPHFLPILQHLSGIFSKAKLKDLVGSVSDISISKPAAARLAKVLTERVDPARINKGEILQRLESTLEGIVRDLVGRVLLESIVAEALKDAGVPYQREHEYESLAGVVYDFRADFVLPDATRPKAFIEVRKSSPRHASLYAKDKMFSAINWKGKSKTLLAVLVVDGEWTGETLRVMANVFDYVVPIGRSAELAETVKSYLNGDVSKLKWLIEFQISSA